MKAMFVILSLFVCTVVYSQPKIDGNYKMTIPAHNPAIIKDCLYRSTDTIYAYCGNEKYLYRPIGLVKFIYTQPNYYALRIIFYEVAKTHKPVTIDIKSYINNSKRVYVHDYHKFINN